MTNCKCDKDWFYNLISDLETIIEADMFIGENARGLVIEHLLDGKLKPLAECPFVLNEDGTTDYGNTILKLGNTISNARLRLEHTNIGNFSGSDIAVSTAGLCKS